MTKKVFIAICVAGIIQSSVVLLYSQAKNNVEQLIQDMGLLEYAPDENASLEDLLSLIRSDAWAMVSQNQKERIKAAFLKQLRHGVGLVGRVESEEGRRHLMLLGQISAELKDPLMVPILVDGVASAYFKDALVAIGRPAISMLVKRFGDKTMAGTAIGKRAILDILGQMGISVAGGRKDVHELLAKACEDKNARVRMSAVRALGEIGDDTFIPMLEKIALNDSGFYDTTIATSSSRSYFVRDTAIGSVEKIKKRISNVQNKR